MEAIDGVTAQWGERALHWAREGLGQGGACGRGVARRAIRRAGTKCLSHARDWCVNGYRVDEVVGVVDIPSGRMTWRTAV